MNTKDYPDKAATLLVQIKYHEGWIDYFTKNNRQEIVARHRKRMNELINEAKENNE